MKSNDAMFREVVDDRIKKIRTILTEKNKEYGSAGDSFHNFKTGGRMEGITPEKALKGIMLKHEVSVNDLIGWTESNPGRITLKLIDEKIGDNINYLILLEGLLRERIAN